MTAIIWNSALSVKIKTIDDQHKKLIELINNFYENLKKHPNTENICELIAGMKKYTIIHFRKEERYMKLFKFPLYESHKREHDEFISRVNDLEKRFNNKKIIISLEITGFIKVWIKKHIQGSDMLYSDFFIKNGVV